MEFKLFVYNPFLILTIILLNLRIASCIKCYFCLDTKERCSKLPLLLDCDKFDFCQLEIQFELIKKYYPDDVETFNTYADFKEFLISTLEDEQTFLMKNNESPLSKALSLRTINSQLQYLKANIKPGCKANKTNVCQTLPYKLANGLEYVEVSCAKEGQCKFEDGECVQCYKDKCNRGRKNNFEKVSLIICLMAVVVRSI